MAGGARRKPLTIRADVSDEEHELVCAIRGYYKDGHRMELCEAEVVRMAVRHLAGSLGLQPKTAATQGAPPPAPRAPAPPPARSS